MSFNVNDYADKLYADVKKMYTEDCLDSVRIFTFLRLTMETVDTYKNLCGPNKKELVIRVIMMALNDYVIPGPEQIALDYFVKFTLSIVIDQFVDINSGKLNINKASCTSFFKKMCPCVSN